MPAFGVAELDQLAAHAVQRQDDLLFLRLERDRLDVALLHRRPDGMRVMHITFVAANKCPRSARAARAPMRRLSCNRVSSCLICFSSRSGFLGRHGEVMSGI